MFIDNYNAGALDDALFYVEKSLIYANGYWSSDKHKVLAFRNKGLCLY